MNIKTAQLHIRNAGIVGIITVISTLITCIKTFIEHGDYDFYLWESIIISVLLTIWIFKKSRFAALFMLIWYSIYKAALLSIYPISIWDIITIIFIYFYFQGVRGTFYYQKEKSVESSIHKKILGWITILIISLLTISLPLTFLNTYSKYKTNDYLLLKAIKENDIQHIQELINEGYNPNISTLLGTPPSVASTNGNFGLVQYLIDNGADPNLPDELGWRPMHHAVLPDTSFSLVILFLVENGADINGTDRHLRTPLHRAAQFGDITAVELLLHLGADPNLKDENGWTPYDRSGKHQEIQELLIKAMKK